MNAFTVVIPARYSSTRLPGKPLLPLGGRPVIEHVWQRATESGARRVIIATDHADIAGCARALGAECCLTDPGHASGTVARRHLGIYAYRAGFLREYAALPVSALEGIEQLEQLRALEAGVHIQVADADEPPGPGIDTAADLAMAEAVIGSTATGDRQ